MRPGFWFLLTIAVAVAVTNLGAARLWDRDEPRNAQCAREMMEADNWVVPMFDGELRTHKPILIYWCQITAYKIFGVNEFAARLPSALAGIFTVLLVYSIAMRLGSPHVAVWSGISLSTMFMFVLAERAATPDALLIVTTTLAIALFVRFAFVPISDNDPKQDRDSNNSHQHLSAVEFRWPTWIQWTIVYAACGLAVLAKGPVGLILPIAVMGLVTLLVAGTPAPTWTLAILNTSRNLFINGWRMKPWLAVAAVFVVAGPWYLAVGLATHGEWLQEFLFTHNVSRAVKPMEGHSGPPVLYYVGTLLVGTFPWSCFAIPIGLSVWRRWKDQRSEGKTIDPMLALGIAWTVVFVGCFSLASTKLPSYVTPCHPAIALVVGWYVARAIADQVDHPRWMRAGLAVATLIGVVMFVAIGGPLANLLPSVRPLAFAGVVFAVAGILGVALATRKQQGLAMRSFVIGAVSVVWLLHGFGPAMVDRGRTDLDALQAAFEQSPDTEWWVSRAPEPTWVFYSNRRVRAGEPPQFQSSSDPSSNETAPENTARRNTMPRNVARIEWLQEPEAGSVQVFMNDEYLRISDVKTARVATRR